MPIFLRRFKTLEECKLFLKEIREMRKAKRKFLFEEVKEAIIANRMPVLNYLKQYGRSSYIKMKSGEYKGLERPATEKIIKK